MISHSRPAPITWSVTGAGASIQTPAERLTNGRPTADTRLRWLSGAQTTASVLSLRGIWANAIVPRLGGLVGLTLPEGTRIVCGLRRATDSGFDYVTVETRVFQRLDGVRVAWFAFDDDLDPCIGVEFSIYNDVNGAAVIEEDSTFEIGEAWIGRGSDWCIRTQYESGRDDLSSLNKSVGGQPFPVRRRAEATSQIEVKPSKYGETFVGQESLSDIRERLLAYNWCVIVPMTSEPYTGGGVIGEFVNRHAEFGYCSSSMPIVGEAPRWLFSATFTAPPALLP